MAIERMGVRVEVWPVAADELAIWLVSQEGDAWRSALIEADSEPHWAMQEVLRDRSEVGATALVHSTSWRVDHKQGAVVLTYVAVLGTHGEAGARNLGGHGEYTYVREVWPDARPLTLVLVELAGKPPRHGPIEPPTPRYLDVLLHGVRHLRFLMDTDASAQAAVDLGQGGVQVVGGGWLGWWGQPDGCGGHEDGLPCDGRDLVVSQATGRVGTAGWLLLPSPRGP